MRHGGISWYRNNRNRIAERIKSETSRQTFDFICTVVSLHIFTLLRRVLFWLEWKKKSNYFDFTSDEIPNFFSSHIDVIAVDFEYFFSFYFLVFDFFFFFVCNGNKSMKNFNFQAIAHASWQIFITLFSLKRFSDFLFLRLDHFWAQWLFETLIKRIYFQLTLAGCWFGFLNET